MKELQTTTKDAAEHPEQLQRAAYQAPRVEDLGSWTNLTLIYSVPFQASQGLLDYTFGYGRPQ